MIAHAHKFEEDAGRGKALRDRSRNVGEQLREGMPFAAASAGAKAGVDTGLANGTTGAQCVEADDAVNVVLQPTGCPSAHAPKPQTAHRSCTSGMQHLYRPSAFFERKLCDLRPGR